MFERPPFDNDRIFTGWLEQDATLRPPDDLLERVLSGTAATRRRPGWLVIERWFPMEKTARFGAIPRAALLVGTLGVLLVLLAAIAAASQPRLPDPFGPARNGAIIYSQDGDIHVADADGSNPRAIVTGPDDDCEDVRATTGPGLTLCDDAGLVALQRICRPGPPVVAPPGGSAAGRAVT